MNPQVGPGDGWSFEAPTTRAPRRIAKRWLIIGGVIALVVVLLGGTMLWAAKPEPITPATPRFEIVDKPLLSDEPPTVIKNGIKPRTLYQPGYTDTDYSKSTLNLNIDPAKDYDKTVTPPECGKDPLEQIEHNLDRRDTTRYERYPVDLSMYPVDDPGGNADGSGVFLVSVFPAEDPVSLRVFREWFTRCQSAQVTYTVSQNGQVIESTTEPFEQSLADAPSSMASDSFAVTQRDDPEDSCDYYGLVRGMIVNVLCSKSVKDAGVELFRTVVRRVYDI